MSYGLAMMHRLAPFCAVVVSPLSMLVACAAPLDTASLGPERVDILSTQTVPGADQPDGSVSTFDGQGLLVHDDKVYLYGDAEPGLVREFRLVETPEPQLESTGREIRFTLNGEDVIPHPTGMTYRDGLGLVIGDTVRGVGVHWIVDWDTAWQRGTLDGAVINRIVDDLAVNGCRPEWVRYQDAWFIATSDYGGERNQVRLYDPERLRTASRTSAEGVLVRSWDCGPFVQTLHYLEGIGDGGTLVLVQNTTPGLGYRLTFTSLDPELDTLTGFEPTDIPQLTDELEGFGVIRVSGLGTLGVLLSAFPEDNAHVIRLVDWP